MLDVRNERCEVDVLSITTILGQDCDFVSWVLCELSGMISDESMLGKS